MTGTDPDLGRTLLLIAATISLLVVPLAGCVGGADPGSTEGEQADGDGDDGDGDGDGPGTGTGEDPDAEQAHVHDRWYATPDQRPPGEEADKIALIDSSHTIQSTTDDASEPVDTCRQGGGEQITPCWGTALVTADPAGEEGAGTKIVPPGTEKVTVEIEYDQSGLPAGGYWGIDIFYQHKGIAGGAHWIKLTGQDPAADGDSFEISPVDINGNSTAEPDDGHAEVSQWRFWLEVRGNPTPADPAGHFTGPDGVEVELTVEAHRDPSGDLPLEPPHPTFYEDDPNGPTDVYEIARVSVDSGSGQFFQVGPVFGKTGGECVGEISEDLCLPFRTGDGLVAQADPGFDGRRAGEDAEKLDANRSAPLVPPASELLKAYVSVDGDVNPEGQIEVCVRHRTSIFDSHLGEPFGDECQVLDGSQDQLEFTHVVDGQWDSYYASNWDGELSRWQFLLQVRSPDSAAPDVANMLSFHEPGTFSGTVDATIVATDETTLEEAPSWVFA